MLEEPHGRIEELEEAINEIIGKISVKQVRSPLTFAEVLDVEIPPEKLPASTLLFSYPSQSDGATGGITDNEWRWVQRSYFDNTDPALAQKEMKRLVPALLAAFRQRSVVYLEDGTVARIRLDDAGPPEPAEGRGMPPMFVKTLDLIVETEEE